MTSGEHPSAGPGRDVVKVGGSLFGLEDLPGRLSQWLDRHASPRCLLIAGGGAVADEVRRFADRFGLGEERAHWLAIRAMSLQTHLLAAALDGAAVARDLPQCARLWDAGARRVLLDPYRTLRQHGESLEVGWHVTSDSIAAFVARLAGASRLVLLKSVGADQRISITEAIERGWLDSYFPEAVGSLAVEWVNLRLRPDFALRMSNRRAPTACGANCGNDEMRQY